MTETQTAQFKEMFAPEELDPELKRHICHEPHVGDMIKHPLVYQLFYVPELNRMSNRLLEQKREAIRTATLEKNWSRVIFMYERPHRLDAFRDIADELSDEEYWDLASSVWIDSENIWQMRPMWDNLLHANIPGRENMMKAEEITALSKLSSTIKVYRGCKLHNEDGLSWTTDRAKAEWFASRYRSKMEGVFCLSGTVKRELVIAHLLGRDESEIIAFPEDVQDKTIKAVFA